MTVSTAATWSIADIRQDFPILSRQVYGKPLVYLDNGATAQKPQVVLTAMEEFYSQYNSNVHRGVHALSEQATVAYEQARTVVQQSLHAAHRESIIFTKGCTESINCIAQTYARSILQPGDEILLSTYEHHSNIVPWQLIAAELQCRIKSVPLLENGHLDTVAYQQSLTEKVKIVAITHVSNSLGVINDIAALTAAAHAVGAKVVVDGAQAVPHFSVDVQALDCDFYAFSGHKMFAPTGIGVLYGKKALLEAMPPYQGGGEMIASVSFAKSTYAPLPQKFEAGTPNIAAAIGLAAAFRYLKQLPQQAWQQYEHFLLQYATEQLQSIKGLKIIAPAGHKVPVISFTLQGVHPHDIGTIVDRAGVAIRVGHHCTMPLMQYLQVPATARASLAFYNTTAEVDALVAALAEVRKIFAL